MPTQTTADRRNPPATPEGVLHGQGPERFGTNSSAIRTGHWRLAVFLKRIKKRQDYKCWFCQGSKMTRSHGLLH